jgi:hypothetical protein
MKIIIRINKVNNYFDSEWTIKNKWAFVEEKQYYDKCFDDLGYTSPFGFYDEEFEFEVDTKNKIIYSWKKI